MLQSLFLTTVPSSFKSRNQYKWPSRVRLRDDNMDCSRALSMHRVKGTGRKRVNRLGMYNTRVEKHAYAPRYWSICPNIAMQQGSFSPSNSTILFDSHAFLCLEQGRAGRGASRWQMPQVDRMTDPGLEPSDSLLSTRRNRRLKIPPRYNHVESIGYNSPSGQ